MIARARGTFVERFRGHSHGGPLPFHGAGARKGSSNEIVSKSSAFSCWAPYWSARSGVAAVGARLPSSARHRRHPPDRRSAPASRIRRLRQDRSVAPRAHGFDARERDDQVRLRRDRVVQGRRRRPRRDEPSVTGQVAEGRTAAVAPTSSTPTERRRHDHRGGEARRAVGEDRHGSSRRPTAASPPRCPRTRSRAARDRRRRRRPAGHARAAARRQHGVHRRDGRVATLGGSCQRRLERHRRRHRHGRLARAPDARPTGARRPAGGLKGCQFGDGTDVAASRPDVHVQQQADRRLRQDRHLHGEHRRRGQEFCNNTTD